MEPSLLRVAGSELWRVHVRSPYTASPLLLLSLLLLLKNLNLLGLLPRLLVCAAFETPERGAGALGMEETGSDPGWNHYVGPFLCCWAAAEARRGSDLGEIRTRDSPPSVSFWQRR